MKLVKIILMHNLNNFCYSISMHLYFFRNGMESKRELIFGLLGCAKERMKLFHWKPPNFSKDFFSWSWKIRQEYLPLGKKYAASFLGIRVLQLRKLLTLVNSSIFSKQQNSLKSLIFFKNILKTSLQSFCFRFLYKAQIKWGWKTIWISDNLKLFHTQIIKTSYFYITNHYY